MIQNRVRVCITRPSRLLGNCIKFLPLFSISGNEKNVDIDASKLKATEVQGNLQVTEHPKEWNAFK